MSNLAATHEIWSDGLEFYSIELRHGYNRASLESDGENDIITISIYEAGEVAAVSTLDAGLLLRAVEMIEEFNFKKELGRDYEAAMKKGRESGVPPVVDPNACEPST